MSISRPLFLGVLLECALLMLLLQVVLWTGRPEPSYLIEPKVLGSVTRIGFAQGSTTHWIRREPAHGAGSWVDEARTFQLRSIPDELLSILSQPLPIHQPRVITDATAGVSAPPLMVTLQTPSQSITLRLGVLNRNLQLRYAQVEGQDRVLLLADRLFTVSELALNELTHVKEPDSKQEPVQAVEMQ